MKSRFRWPTSPSRRIRNAKQHARVYYALHMSPGVAEYDEDGEVIRVLVREQAIREMNPTFEGKPVFVQHQEVELPRLQEQADGYVRRSFFNRPDGNTWSELLVVSDAGHDAIAKGWAVSNSYFITDDAGGGRWQNVAYDQEVLRGIFDHMAIVPNPRYEQSIILTPEQFRAYNEQKETELLMLQNSKKEPKHMPFSLVTRRKVRRASELANAIIALGGGREITLRKAMRVVENDLLDEEEERSRGRRGSRSARRRNADEGGGSPATPLDAEVTVADQKMTVRELIQAYLEIRRRDADEGGSRQNRDDDEDGETRREKKKENAARRRRASIAANGLDDQGGDFQDDDLDDFEGGLRDEHEEDEVRLNNDDGGGDDDLDLDRDDDDLDDQGGEPTGRRSRRNAREGDDDRRGDDRRASDRRPPRSSERRNASSRQDDDLDGEFAPLERETRSRRNARDDDQGDDRDSRAGRARRDGDDDRGPEGSGRDRREAGRRNSRTSSRRDDRGQARDDTRQNAVRKQRQENADSLRNARDDQGIQEEAIDTTMDQVQRGLTRYGSPQPAPASSTKH